MSDKELLFKIYKDIIHSIKKNYMGRELESTFSQRRQTVTKRQMKRWTTSLIIREMQIKITVRYHLTSVKMVINKKLTNNKYLWIFGLKKKKKLFLWSKLHALLLSHFSRVWLFATLWTVAHQSLLSMEFSRQVYWSRFPCPPKDLPNQRIETSFLISLVLAGEFFRTSPTWEAHTSWFSHCENKYRDSFKN